MLSLPPSDSKLKGEIVILSSFALRRKYIEPAGRNLQKLIQKNKSLKGISLREDLKKK